MSAGRVNTGLDHRAPPRTDRTRSLPIALPWVAQRMARVVLRRRYRVEVHGAGRVPRSGPVLLSVNHIGYLDGPLLGAVAPRVSHALVKNEMFVGRTGRLLAAVGQIPVERLEMDPAAVRRCVRALRQRRAVVVFPEPPRPRHCTVGDRRHVAATAARSEISLPGRAPDEVDDLVLR